MRRGRLCCAVQGWGLVYRVGGLVCRIGYPPYIIVYWDPAMWVPRHLVGPGLVVVLGVDTNTRTPGSSACKNWDTARLGSLQCPALGLICPGPFLTLT